MKKQEQEQLLQEVMKRWISSQEESQFLLLSIGAIHYDVLNLEKRGVCGFEIESIKRTLDSVEEYITGKQ